MTEEEPGEPQRRRRRWSNAGEGSRRSGGEMVVVGEEEGEGKAKIHNNNVDLLVEKKNLFFKSVC